MWSELSLICWVSPTCKCTGSSCRANSLLSGFYCFLHGTWHGAMDSHPRVLSKILLELFLIKVKSPSNYFVDFMFISENKHAT